MSTLKRLFARVRNFVTGRSGDQRLREEMDEHLAFLVEENIGAGMQHDEARRQAKLKLGGLEQIREDYHAEEGLPLVESALQDLRYAFRVLRKSSGFTVIAVLTLALGIGANLTVFLILYGVLLRPLPFPHPQQLVRICRFYPALENTVVPAYSGTKALFLRQTNRTLQSAAAYDYIPSHVNMIRDDQVVPLDVLRVTSDFFHVFQMEPQIGRGFRAEDMVLNAPGVAVLSDAIWRQQFGAAPDMIGRSITLGDRSYTVIGVANPEFRLDSRVDMWTPLQIAESPTDQSNLYNFVGRLRPGVTRTQAEGDLRRVLSQLKNTYPNLWDQNESLRVFDFHESLVGQLRPALMILMGAVGLVLVIASANILSLLLTRSIARRREMTLRAALGASAWRILRQLLVENSVICALGGVFGILLALYLTPALMHLSPLPIPKFASLHIGSPALLFTSGLVLACVFLFSLVPAVATTRTQLSECLRISSAQIASGGNLPQKSLVVTEVAISLVLMVAAGLLLTTFWKLVHISPGFDAKNVLTFKTTFAAQQATTSAALGQRLNEIIAHLEAQPGIEAAATVNSLPTQLTPTMPFEILGRSPASPDAGGSEDYLPITPEYFKAMSIPVVAGRSFRLSDAPGTQPVVIINQQIARTYFNGQNPVGRHIRIGAAMGPGFEDKVREIIGVVGDTKNSGLNVPTPGILYLPQSQIPDQETQMQIRLLGVSWVVRTGAGRVDAATAARRILMDDARAPLLSVETMSQVIRASVAQQRFSMILLSGFGLISLVLGAAGLYGVMSHNVARQRREIGVRMAMGARRENIAAMVLKDASVMVGIGLIVGIVLSLAASRILSSLLFGVIPRDPATLVAASTVLLLTGLVAAWWPARRAARVEPMEALRGE